MLPYLTYHFPYCAPSLFTPSTRISSSPTPQPTQFFLLRSNLLRCFLSSTKLHTVANARSLISTLLGLCVIIVSQTLDSALSLLATFLDFWPRQTYIHLCPCVITTSVSETFSTKLCASCLSARLPNKRTVHRQIARSKPPRRVHCRGPWLLSDSEKSTIAGPLAHDPAFNKTVGPGPKSSSWLRIKTNIITHSDRLLRRHITLRRSSRPQTTITPRNSTSLSSKDLQFPSSFSNSRWRNQLKRGVQVKTPGHLILAENLEPLAFTQIRHRERRRVIFWSLTLRRKPIDCTARQIRPWP
jgi:hypothetical protein